MNHAAIDRLPSSAKTMEILPEIRLKRVIIFGI
jgi:hypothetical protein